MIPAQVLARARDAVTIPIELERVVPRCRWVTIWSGCCPGIVDIERGTSHSAGLKTLRPKELHPPNV